MVLFFIGLLLGFNIGLYVCAWIVQRRSTPVTSSEEKPPEDDLDRPSGVCGVPNCRIRRPHSHVEALIEWMKGR